MSTKHVSQPSNESHPTLADGAASAESQALAGDAGAVAGAQTAQSPKNYKPLKSVDGRIVGHVCIVCGRLHTAPHFESCSIGNPKPKPIPDYDFCARALAHLEAAGAALREFMEGTHPTACSTSTKTPAGQ